MVHGGELNHRQTADNSLELKMDWRSYSGHQVHHPILDPQAHLDSTIVWDINMRTPRILA